jgi:hypothetical protein
MYEEHARRLLAIPRVVALEPGRLPVPGFLREAAPARQARRLKFPGRPRLAALYGPTQYRLARALSARYEAELWYLPPDPLDTVSDENDEREELDRLARERATVTIPVSRGDDVDERLLTRMRELGIISHRPFVPGARAELP